MIDYMLTYPDKLLNALIEHMYLVFVSLFFSLLLAGCLMMLLIFSKKMSTLFIYMLSVVYSIPSIALFALLIPWTGLGETTAILVLVAYNQYLLLRNIMTGLNEVPPALLEAARGMGMGRLQMLIQVQLPMATQSILTGIRLAIVSTIGIATIASIINAGGIGVLLFDGLRTLNSTKIIWGSLLAAVLAIGSNHLLARLQYKIKRYGD